MDIVFIANSPGELSALVRPVAKLFKEKVKDSRIFLFLTPCQYSSGNEAEFAKKNLAVDEIITANDYKKWLLGSPLPSKIPPNEKGIVLFLGGDMLHATIIAKKLNYKAYAYLAGKNVSWISVFTKFFVPEKKIFDKKIPEAKMIEVGDLMAEPQEAFTREVAREKWHLDPDRPLLAMMPGSRMWEISHLMPIYEKIGKDLKKKDPDIQLMLIISPFTNINDVESFKEHHIFDVFAPFDSLRAADMVVTIPGTNTAQIAALGLPMLVVFPLDKPEVIPLEGLAHYIGAIPVLGYLLKKIIAKVVNAKTKYFALPNIKADQFIVPEIRGKIDPVKTAEKIFLLLSDKALLNDMSKKLIEIMNLKNSSGKIVETILNENIS